MHWKERSQRRPAFNLPGHAHALTFSTHERYPFLQADRTCEWLADALNKARVEHHFALWAYVFMPDHVHLLVYPLWQVYDISVIEQAIKAPVGRDAVAYLKEHAPHWLPRITVRRGQREERRFWQAGGGFDRNVDEPRALHEMVAYDHNNPVRKGLCQRPEDWKWSSAGWFAGLEPNSLRPDPIPADWMVVEMVRR
jgi:putative transposase